jgi:hypothetical protein
MLSGGFMKYEYNSSIDREFLILLSNLLSVQEKKEKKIKEIIINSLWRREKDI